VDVLRQARQPIADTGYRWGEVLALARAYLAQGDLGASIEQFRRFLVLAGPENLTRYHAEFASALSGLEEAYQDPTAFRAFCGHFREEQPEIDRSPCVQWYLEPARPSECTSGLVCDEFAGPSLVDWAWCDPFGDCSYTVRDGLQIEAANGRDMWLINLGAPRVLRPASNGVDFVAQTVCRPVGGETPAIGGLLLWQDEQNYLRLDRGRWGGREVVFHGCLGNEDLVVGRGRLPSDQPGDQIPAGQAGRVFLRLARVGRDVQALCSSDGQHWYSVGSVSVPAAGSFQIGLHAIGAVDRLVYPGAHPNGTAILFESFQMWMA
jgi:hypothetical protein